MTHFRHRSDASRQAIVDILERLGWSVRLLSGGDGTPDLLLARGGRTVVCEVKSGQTGYGKRLRASQTAWRDGWRGDYVVLHSEAEAAAWALAGRGQEGR